jgi:hypothetical protein
MEATAAPDLENRLHCACEFYTQPQERKDGTFVSFQPGGARYAGPALSVRVQESFLLAGASEKIHFRSAQVLARSGFNPSVLTLLLKDLQPLLYQGIVRRKHAGERLPRMYLRVNLQRNQPGPVLQPLLQGLLQVVQS